MSKILSYKGQKNKSQSKVVEFPALIKSGMKPIKYWADGGLIYCADPNKPKEHPTWSQPEDALRRVAAAIKIFAKDMEASPKDYHVKQQVLWDFFMRFKVDVFDEALRQDETGGSPVQKIRDSFVEAKKEAAQALLVEASKYESKKTKIFVTPKALDSKD